VALLLALLAPEVALGQVEALWEGKVGINREFRGTLPDRPDELVRVNIFDEWGVLSAIYQRENTPQRVLLTGEIDLDGSFYLHELDSEGSASGLRLRGHMAQGLSGYLLLRSDSFTFDFEEIDIFAPPPFSDGTQLSRYAPCAHFDSIFNDFPWLELPSELAYQQDQDDTLRWLEEFRYKPVVRFGSSAPPLSIAQRNSFLVSAQKVGKVVFPNGDVGFLVQAHYDLMFDGYAFETYIYAYRPDGTFANGLLLYQSANPISGNPEVAAKVSESVIFTITDYRNSTEGEPPLTHVKLEDGHWKMLVH